MKLIIPSKRTIKRLYKHIKNKLKLYFRKNKKEILLVLSWIGGWTLCLWGLSEIWGNIVYKIGYGLLLLSFTGFKLIIKIFLEGLYTLSE